MKNAAVAKLSITLLGASILATFSYLSSRGADGNPMLAIVGIGLFTFTYIPVVSRIRGRTIYYLLFNLLLFETVVLATLKTSNLEEMAGTIELAWPAAVFCICTLSMLLHLVSSKRTAIHRKKCGE